MQGADTDPPDVTRELGRSAGSHDSDSSEILTQIEAALPAAKRAGADVIATPIVGPGQRIGRFTVLRELGRGGMGVVLAAFDEELDRKIAIKLLRPDLSGDSLGHARLLREAQAMARLSHPNVAQVHEVGEHDGHVFLAMELVAGETLRQWLAGDRRPLAEVLGVMRQAGAGLLAAHRAGLVHRDFKPDNVIVGDDGRVRVLDFGIARGGEIAQGSGTGDPEAPRRRVEATLTIADTVVGTPAYMAPEQFVGRAADARCDQFSYCVVLYEALYGIRPFTGDGIESLRNAIERGIPAKPPEGRGAPAWLRRVLARGLERDPDARWPSMEAVLEQLARDPARDLRRGVVAGFGVMLLGVGYAAASVEGASADPCAAVGVRIDDAWDPTRRDEVRVALLATGVAYAEDTWSRVERSLDAWAQRWAAGASEACEVHRRGEQSDTLFDLRMQCLERRRQDFTALVDVLATADRTAVLNAAQAAADLGGIESCADADALTSETVPSVDPKLAAAAATLWERHARGQAHLRAGQLRAGLEVANDLLASSRALALRPFVARSLFLKGQLHLQLRESAAAVAAFDEASLVAESAAMDEAKARALIYLVFAVGYESRRPAEGFALAKRAEASVTRIDDHGELLALLTNNIGSVQLWSKDFVGARESFARAVAIGEAAGVPESAATTSSLTNLGGILYQLGEYEQALATQQRALEIHERTLGDGHPVTGHTLLNLASALHGLIRYDEALGYFDRGVAAFDGGFGREHLLAASARIRRAYLLRRMGRLHEARTDLEDALAVYSADDSHEHPDIASILNNLAELSLATGDLVTARAHFERARAIWEKHNLAHYLAYPAAGLGRIAAMQGDLVTARAELERSLALRAEHKALPDELAESRFALAQVLPATERERARTLAEQAREIYARAGPYHADRHAEVTRWLSASAG